MLPSSRSPLRQRLLAYLHLMRVDRPIGTLLLLWPTLWGLWVAAAGRPDPWVLTVFLIGVFLMRSAGCVINDVADRRLDPMVARTRERPIASGRVGTGEALLLFVVLISFAFALALTLNRLAVLWSLPAIAIAVIYPFMKRVTHLPQLVLGIAFSMGIPMAFAAQTGAVPAVAWLLVAANLAWVVAYDTMYALVDIEDDIKAGIKSTAILFGAFVRALTGLLQVITLVLLLVLGWHLQLNSFYYGAIAFAAALAIYQQILIRNHDAAECFKAFLNNAWFGAIVFIGFVLSYL